MTYEELCEYWKKYPYTTYISVNSSNTFYHINENPAYLKIKCKLKGCILTLDRSSDTFNRLGSGDNGDHIIFHDNGNFYIVSHAKFIYYNKYFSFSKQRFGTEIKRVFFI